MSPDRDDDLVAQLAAALGPDLDPPPAVLHAARESFTWRTVDAELAALTVDSALDGEPVGSRSALHPRTLTFEASSTVIEVEIFGRPGERRLVGQLDPPEAARLELCTGEHSVAGAADELGRFVLALPSTQQLCSLRCHLDAGIVQTAWTLL